MTGNTLLYIIVSGYAAIVLGVGIWAIVKAKRDYREHKKFIESIKVGDEVKYRNLHFEVIKMNNQNIGPTTGIKIKTEGWLYKEDFGFLRPTK